MDKDKKKTLTISSNLKKKIDPRSISTSGKKSFFVDKKKPYKTAKTNKLNPMLIKLLFDGFIIDNPEPKKLIIKLI